MSSKTQIPHVKWAESASKTWSRLNQQERDNLSQFFHLRPTSSGITIVSSHPEAPMRGIPYKLETELEAKLHEIARKFHRLCAIGSQPSQTLKDLGFQERKTGDTALEEQVQALMINMMDKSSSLQRALNSESPIRFIASELIFQKGKYRVDIVGFNDKDIYLFELKRNRTTKVEQVSDYVDYYNDHRDQLAAILSAYPIHSVKSFDKIVGVMVMEHAGNSVNRSDWSRLRKEHGIHVLFYKKSLSFESNACGI